MRNEEKELDFNNVDKVLNLRCDFVTCITCDCCYDQNGNPTFCQRNSLAVNPSEVLDNQNRAKDCSGWFPKLIGRKHASRRYDKDDERWYEKDSMA